MVETPSGKGAGDENFPVGSWLLARDLRPHVARFYAFARAIDDIADNPALDSGDKIRRLDAMAEALEGGKTGDPAFASAHLLHTSLIETNVPSRHCHDLIAAFKQDATKLRYRDWDDLMGYCFLSAAPVGRYLLDLHGESESVWPASDALCNALQVLNHLQDCKDDYLNLDRVYLPQMWLDREGGSVDELNQPDASPALKIVIDQTLDNVEELLIVARTLPSLLKSRRLAMESAAIVGIAEMLTQRLRRQDPIAGRVELSRLTYVWCVFKGVACTFLNHRSPTSAMATDERGS